MDIDPQFGIGVLLFVHTSFLFYFFFFSPFCLLCYKQYPTESYSFDLHHPHHPHLEGTFTDLTVVSGSTPLRFLDMSRSANRNYTLVFWPCLFSCSPYAGTDL